MNTAQARFCFFCKAVGNQSLAFFHSLLIQFVEIDVSFNFLSLKLGLKSISTTECEMCYEFFLNFRVLAVLLLWVLVCQYRWRSVSLFNHVGRSGVDRASSSDARGPGFEPRPLHLKKYHFFTPKP